MTGFLPSFGRSEAFIVFGVPFLLGSLLLVGAGYLIGKKVTQESEKFQTTTVQMNGLTCNQVVEKSTGRVVKLSCE